MASSDLMWDLLLEHLKLDDEKLIKQKEKMREVLKGGYGRDIKKGMPLERLIALNEKIENEVYEKKNLVEGIHEAGNGVYEVKLLSFKCPLQKAAAKNPKVCGFHIMHYSVLGELCGWDIKPKSVDYRKTDCTCVLSARQLPEIK